MLTMLGYFYLVTHNHYHIVWWRFPERQWWKAFVKSYARCTV